MSVNLQSHPTEEFHAPRRPISGMSLLPLINALATTLVPPLPSSRAPSADPTLDCSWRRLAQQHAPSLLSPRLYTPASARVLHNALELETLCGEAFAWPDRHEPPRAKMVVTEPSIFVSPSGNDAASGTMGAPLQTLRAALARVRLARNGTTTPASILLRAGTYRLGQSLVLGHHDSNLTIAAYGVEEAIVSGATLLSGLRWRPSPPGHAATLPSTQAAQLSSTPLGPMPALRVRGQRATRARYPNANPELDLFPTGYIHEKTSWLPPVYPPYSVPGSARCNSRTLCGPSANVTITAPPEEWHGMYQRYEMGYGGACTVYDPPRSPWCSGRFYLERQFPEMHYRAPAGVVAAPHLPNGPYGTTEGAVVVAWRPHHWYTWMFGVKADAAGHNGGAANASELLFGAGGNQGGEGAEYADEWYIENVAEELDAPNEYYYDPATRVLRFVYNATAGAPVHAPEAAAHEGRGGGASGTATPPSEAEVPLLTNLIELRGSADQPVRDVTLRGLTLRDTRPSYLDAHGVPSGGDWALQRRGAIFLEGTANVTIEGSTFTHLDSHAIFLSGHNRRARIADNEFVWLGASAIASWGWLDGETNSGLGGAQPRGTVIEGNLCHEIGHYQKQSSFYFQAITAQTTLRRNVVFNIPRAHSADPPGLCGVPCIHARVSPAIRLVPSTISGA